MLYFIGFLTDPKKLFCAKYVQKYLIKNIFVEGTHELNSQSRFFNIIVYFTFQSKNNLFKCMYELFSYFFPRIKIDNTQHKNYLHIICGLYSN